MKPRTESTAKMGAKRCESWGGRGDCEGDDPLIGIIQIPIEDL